MSRRCFRAFCTALFVAAFICGCGRDGGPERVEVSGNVTYRGKPIINGLIRFINERTSGAPSAGAFIVDGKYAVTSHGGVPVGEHRVQIEAFEPIKGAPSSEDGPIEGAVGRGPQFLPEKYNRRSELRLTVPSGSGSIVKNFDLD